MVAFDVDVDNQNQRDHDFDSENQIDGRVLRAKYLRSINRSAPDDQYVVDVDTDSEDDSDRYSICPSSITRETEFSIDDFDQCARESRSHLVAFDRRALDQGRASLPLVSPQRTANPQQKPFAATEGMASQVDRRQHGGAFKTFFKDMRRSLFGRNGKRAHRSSAGSTSQRSDKTRNHQSNQARLNASKAWSSQNEHFNRLKFYVWTGGSPGFTLKRIAEGEKTGQLAIKAVANLSAWSTGIRPGDILESVSGTSVHGMGPEEAMSLVETSEAPLVLRFSAFTNGSTTFDFPQRFQVTLGNQRLGVQFMGDGKEAVPVVTRIPNSASQGHRNANIPAIRLGDVLVAVNHVDAIALGLEDAMAVIAASPKPVKLTFQRLSSELGLSVLRSTDLVARASSSQQHQQHINSRRGRCSQVRSSLSAPTPTAARDFISKRSRVRSMVELGRMSASEDIDLAFADFDAATGGVGGSEVIRARIGEVILIIWREGPLGLTLFEDDISGLPLVNRLTGKGSSVGIEHLQHGYLLDSVNGVKTEGQNFLTLCEGLSSIEKPVMLLFRTPPKHGFGDNESFTFSVNSSSHQSSSSQSGDSGQAESVCLRQTTSLPHSRGDEELRDDEYELLWHAGEKLGLVLGTQSRGHLRDSTASGCDSTAQPPMVVKIQPSCPLRFQEDAVGDALVAVNNLRTEGLGQRDVRLLLESASKPALLRFRSHNSNANCLEHRRTASLSSESSASSSCTDSEKRDFEFDDSDSNDGADDRESGGATGASSSARSFATSYNLLWSTGHLGLTFSSYEDSDCENAIVVFVKCVGRLGHAKRTRLVRVGDRLASVNGKRVEVANQRAFHELMRSLATKSKPVVLGFQRPMVEFGDESSL